jgi:hypothetical protein
LSCNRLLESFLWTPIWVDLRFAKWQEMWARPEPLASRKVPHLMWRYSRTIAYAVERQAGKPKPNKLSMRKKPVRFGRSFLLGRRSQ